MYMKRHLPSCFASDKSEIKMKLIASYLIDKETSITTYCLSVRSSAYSIRKNKESQAKWAACSR